MYTPDIPQSACLAAVRAILAAEGIEHRSEYLAGGIFGEVVDMPSYTTADGTVVERWLLITKSEEANADVMVGSYIDDGADSWEEHIDIGDFRFGDLAAVVSRGLQGMALDGVLAR
jgi:hypothetical protein